MFTLLHVALLTCGLGTSLLNQSLPYEKNNNNEYQLKYDNHKNVVYNDNNYTISLSANELNNYHWDNFNNAFDEYYSEEGLDNDNFFFGSYGGYDVNYHDYDIYMDYNSPYMYMSCIYSYMDTSVENVAIYFNRYVNDYADFYQPYTLANDNKFHISNYVENDDKYILSEFEYSLVLSFDTEINRPYYVGFKHAIELDYQANQTYSFDDEHYQITISADYLNNVEFRHLFAYLFDYQSYDYLSNAFDDTIVYYKNIPYPLEEYLSDELYYLYNNHYIRFFNDDSYRIYYYDSNLPTSIQDFDDSVVWHLNLYVYANVKNALQQDFYYYSLPVYNPFMEIVDLMTSGITTFATGLGAGVSELVDDVFLTEDNHLSVFASITIVFAGIALAIGLSRYVMNYLTSLGAKK